MKETPVPVVSSRYLLASTPPNVMVASKPAVRAMLVNENPGGSASCCAARPFAISIASAMIAAAAGRRAWDMPGTARMLPPQVRGQAARGLVLGERFGTRAAAAKRQRQLIVCLRILGCQAHRLAEFANRTRRFILLHAIESGLHGEDRRLRICLEAGQSLRLREGVGSSGRVVRGGEPLPHRRVSFRHRGVEANRLAECVQRATVAALFVDRAQHVERIREVWFS